MIYILTIALTFSLFLFSPVKLSFIFYKEDSNEHFEISLDYFHIINMNFKIPEMFFHMKNLIPFLTLKLNLSNKKISKSENKKIVISPLRLKALILKLYRQIKRFRHATILFLKTVRFIKANIQIMFAAEDPAVSCFIVGGVLSFLYFILSFISYYINFDKSSISLNVKPVNFMSNSIKVFFSGIIELRIAHIIIGGLLLFVVWLFPERIDIKLRRAKKYGWTSH